MRRQFAILVSGPEIERLIESLERQQDGNDSQGEPPSAEIEARITALYSLLKINCAPPAPTDDKAFLQSVFDALHRSAPVEEVTHHIQGAGRLHSQAFTAVRDRLEAAQAKDTPA